MSRWNLSQLSVVRNCWEIESNKFNSIKTISSVTIDVIWTDYTIYAFRVKSIVKWNGYSSNASHLFQYEPPLVRVQFFSLSTVCLCIEMENFTQHRTQYVNAEQVFCRFNLSACIYLYVMHDLDLCTRKMHNKTKWWKNKTKTLNSIGDNETKRAVQSKRKAKCAWYAYYNYNIQCVVHTIYIVHEHK